MVQQSKSKAEIRALIRGMRDYARSCEAAIKKAKKDISFYETEAARARAAADALEGKKTTTTKNNTK
jgi:hypothetical protein